MLDILPRSGNLPLPQPAPTTTQPAAAQGAPKPEGPQKFRVLTKKQGCLFDKVRVYYCVNTFLGDAL